MTVVDRAVVNNYTYTYTVIRGQNQTIPINHGMIQGINYNTMDIEYNEEGLLYNGVPIEGATFDIFTNTMVIETVFPVEGGAQASWKNIPNMPADSRSDRDGNVSSLWASQEEYSDWFKQQVRLLGGELSGNQYRFPLEYTNNQDIEFKAEDAIANPSIEVITAVLPGSG